MRLCKLCFAFAAVISLVGLSGCGGSASSSSSSKSTSSTPEAVFIGSSQTFLWPLATFFPHKNYVNKGVDSDKSADMLARFQTDVVALHPRVVLIWSGENDIQKGVSVSDLEANVTAMHEQGRAAGIRVILCTLAPKGQTQADENPSIVQFDDWLRSFAAANRTVLADYYPVLVDGNGQLRADYSILGEHLNNAGYTAITPVANDAIQAAER